MRDLLLAVDLGSTNCKAAAVDVRGRVVAQHSAGYATYHPQDGWSEQNADDWDEALATALRNVADQLGARTKDLRGLSAAAHGPTLVLLDAQGHALAPCPTWQDQRSARQGEELRAMLAARWVGGQGPPKTGLAAKLLWAKANWPAAFAGCAYALDLKAYVMYWLTGTAGTEPSSGPGTGVWPKVVFDAVGFPVEKLPPVYPSLSKIGGLRHEVAARCGLPAGLPVYLGLNDGASSTLGTGAIAPGDACVSIGTNGVARLVLDQPFDAARGLELDAFFWPYVPGRWVVGGMILTGGASLAWLHDVLGGASYDALIDEAATSEPGARGVLFWPYLAGRSAPHPDPQVRAAFMGLSLRHGRADMARAVLEGVAYAINEVYTTFRGEGFALGDVHITGGGAQSALWRQIIADVLERRLILTGGDASLGAAIMAAVGAGIYPDVPAAVAAMVRPLGETQPDPQTAPAYRESFALYRRLSDGLRRVAG